MARRAAKPTPAAGRPSASASALGTSASNAPPNAPTSNAPTSNVAVGDRFDHPLLHLPLDATAVIEASAGTGKTWTISGLYLRLLVEHALEPNAILVVTFTIAATAELKERIRNRLHALRIALEHDGNVGDPLIAELISRAVDRDALRRRVAFFFYYLE